MLAAIFAKALYYWLFLEKGCLSSRQGLRRFKGTLYEGA